MLDSLSTYEIFLGRGFSETNITFWGSFKWPLPFERHYTRSGEEVISSDDDNDKHDDNDKDNDNDDTAPRSTKPSSKTTRMPNKS